MPLEELDIEGRAKRSFIIGSSITITLAILVSYFFMDLYEERTLVVEICCLKGFSQAKMSGGPLVQEKYEGQNVLVIWPNGKGLKNGAIAYVSAKKNTITGFTEYRFIGYKE